MIFSDPCGFPYCHLTEFPDRLCLLQEKNEILVQISVQYFVIIH